jgi:hypothetical protein
VHAAECAGGQLVGVSSPAEPDAAPATV